jgi:hypothetical protein
MTFVKDRIGAQLVIPLERHDETRQIVTGNRVDGSASRKNSPKR